MPAPLFDPIANLGSQQPKWPNQQASWLFQSRSSEPLEPAKPRFPLKPLQQLASLDTAGKRLSAPAGKWGRHRSTAVESYSLDFRLEILELDRAKTPLLGDQISIRRSSRFRNRGGCGFRSRSRGLLSLGRIIRFRLPRGRIVRFRLPRGRIVRFRLPRGRIVRLGSRGLLSRRRIVRLGSWRVLLLSRSLRVLLLSRSWRVLLLSRSWRVIASGFRRILASGFRRRRTVCSEFSTPAPDRTCCL